MDPAEARSQLGLIERTLARSAGRGIYLAPLSYIVWGLVAPAFQIPWMPNGPRNLAPALFNIGITLNALGMLLTLIEFRRSTRDRVTTIDRQALLALAGITTLLWTLKIGWLEHGIITGYGFGFVWATGMAVALLVVGLAQRELLIGALFLTATIYIASYQPAYASVWLTLGSVIGISGPGIYFLMRPRTHG